MRCAVKSDVALYGGRLSVGTVKIAAALYGGRLKVTLV